MKQTQASQATSKKKTKSSSKVNPLRKLIFLIISLGIVVSLLFLSLLFDNFTLESPESLVAELLGDGPAPDKHQLHDGFAFLEAEQLCLRHTKKRYPKAPSIYVDNRSTRQVSDTRYEVVIKGDEKDYYSNEEFILACVADVKAMRVIELATVRGHSSAFQ